MDLTSEAEFVEYVKDLLDLSTCPTLDTGLFDDIGLDSLSVYELLVAFEDNLGVELDESAWASAETIGDYFTICKNARREQLVHPAIGESDVLMPGHGVASTAAPSW
jgi:acyl carrier protein